MGAKCEVMKVKSRAQKNGRNKGRILAIECPYEFFHFSLTPRRLIVYCYDFWTQAISDDEDSHGSEMTIIVDIAEELHQHYVHIGEALSTYKNDGWVPNVVDAVVMVALALHLPGRMSVTFLRHIFPYDLANHFWWKWTGYDSTLVEFTDESRVRLWYCGMTSDNKVLLLDYLKVKAFELSEVLRLVPSAAFEQQTPTRG
jgi:hypothetical protein